MIYYEEMDEERKIAYEGITRAEREHYLTHTKMRTLYGRTNMNPVSRFIHEIPEDLIDGMEQSKAKRFGSLDRKSTRLNSSHVAISYAVFCLKKKKKKKNGIRQ